MPAREVGLSESETATRGNRFGGYELRLARVFRNLAPPLPSLVLMRVSYGIKISDDLATLLNEEELSKDAKDGLAAVARQVVDATLKERGLDLPKNARNPERVREWLAAAQREIADLLMPFNVTVSVDALTNTRTEKTDFNFRFHK